MQQKRKEDRKMKECRRERIKKDATKKGKDRRIKNRKKSKIKEMLNKKVKWKTFLRTQLIFFFLFVLLLSFFCYILQPTLINTITFVICRTDDVDDEDGKESKY